LQTDECRAALDVDNGALVSEGKNLNLTLANAPMRDFDPPDQRRHLPNAVRQLTNLLNVGHRVYVHCTAGLNRSPLTALGYLTFVEQKTADEAMSVIRNKRAEADPSWEAYHGCRLDLLDALKRHVHVCAYYLSQLSSGDHADDHWYQAETHTLSGLFTQPGTYPTARLDPSREEFVAA
jgi:hypothetical protein